MPPPITPISHLPSPALRRIIRAERFCRCGGITYGQKVHEMKRVLLIDGQGGGMGAQLAKLLLPRLPADCELLAVGTNVLATSAMLKAGAARGATGENAVIYNAARADVILGPIGILMANGILGEVSPKMSVAVSGSEAVKVLIPASGCGIFVAGTQDCRLDDYLQNAVALTLRALDA